ncbi:MAG: aspartate dehydrogenase [Methanoregulaceae archaeon]
MIRVGLLGCGNIGHIIAKHADSIKISALFDHVPEKAEELAKITGGTAYRDFSSFVAADVDLFLEAASVKAVKLYGREILTHKKDIVIMSVGALANKEFHDQLVAAARENGRKIHVPSGAVFGLDNLKIGQISSINKLLLKTTKSPASLGINADEKRLIFRGKANECIKAYPKNVNVSVALGLAAGRDADVELWVDPEIDRNIHEIMIEGDFGDTYIRVRNLPSPDNPATSYLAALSILSLLRNLEQTLVVGT